MLKYITYVYIYIYIYIYSYISLFHNSQYFPPPSTRHFSTSDHLFHLGALSNGTNLLQGSPFRLHQRRLSHLAVFNKSIYPFIDKVFVLCIHSLWFMTQQLCKLSRMYIYICISIYSQIITNTLRIRKKYKWMSATISEEGLLNPCWSKVK